MFKLTKLEKFLVFIGWYRLCRFFENWIYPAYDLRNLLFHRYDLIKIKSIKPYEYAEPEELIFEANMTLIKKFIEEYNPEKHICWYTDNFGNDVGRKYGEYHNEIIIFPEYKGKYIMDIIKEIYHWYTVDYPDLMNQFQYINQFIYENSIGGEFKFIEQTDDFFMLQLDESSSPKTIEELKSMNLEIINKLFKNKEDILSHDKLHEKGQEIFEKIDYEKQKYLYLCIAVRPYLWT